MKSPGFISSMLEVTLITDLEVAFESYWVYPQTQTETNQVPGVHDA